MSLYSSLRPKNFDEIYGNDEVVQDLESFVKRKSTARPHAYLFVGPSGCGKTTIARILADKYGCDGIDMQELNAANTRGIDTVRDVASQAILRPMSPKSKCRFYIIDESHQLTSQAQQALLKIIEDCPDWTYFAFCTTNPERLLGTVVNRCSKFSVSELRQGDMGDLLEDTLDRVKQSIKDDVFAAVVRSANGSPRALLVILEQVLAIEGPAEQIRLCKEALIGFEIEDLCDAILDRKSWEQLIPVYREVRAYKGAEIESIRRAILHRLKSLLFRKGEDWDLISDLIKVFEKSTFESGEPTLVRQLYDSTII